MTKGRAQKPPKSEGPAVAVKQTAVTPEGLEVTLSIRNTGDRALHYVSDIRTLRYDSATGQLVVGLSDAGRQRLPSSVFRLPNFKYVDPHSEAELTIRVPPRIVRLTTGSTPEGAPIFEEHRPVEATQVQVEMAWADTPYYVDARARDEHQLPTASWAQGHAVASAAIGKRGTPKARR
jgi:hypothetical protein